VEADTLLVDAAGRRIATAIVEEAARWGAELIVMGTHGRHGFEHLILGSVAEGVVRRAVTPVLLIRAG
jgi:nucleotide-binding universal stress UspA family protein